MPDVVVIRSDISQEDREFLLGLTREALGQMFWSSPWRSGESEVIARQTLRACGANLRTHGDPFSWMGTNLLASHGARLVDNPAGLRKVIATGYLVQEDAPTGLEPPKDTLQIDESTRFYALRKSFLRTRVPDVRSRTLKTRM